MVSYFNLTLMIFMVQDTWDGSWMEDMCPRCLGWGPFKGDEKYILWNTQGFSPRVRGFLGWSGWRRQNLFTALSELMRPHLGPQRNSGWVRDPTLNLGTVVLKVLTCLQDRSEREQETLSRCPWGVVCNNNSCERTGGCWSVKTPLGSCNLSGLLEQPGTSKPC